MATAGRCSSCAGAADVGQPAGGKASDPEDYERFGLSSSSICLATPTRRATTARLARFDGAYLRFAGDIEVSHRRGGQVIETHKDEAIWELMYFGRARGE